jgi:cytidylate kinase
MVTVIAIDGPGGVGKTTVSRAVAETLGFDHLDTGAFYRAATVAVLVRKIDPRSDERVASAIIGVDMDYVDGAMLLEGIDISGAIRTDIVTREVSPVAANFRVRRKLVELQRQWVEGRIGAVVEGRDIGTVVFPDASLKIHLTARPEIRAARRAGEVATASVDQVASDLARRDALDMNRAASPLEVADDAVVVDTSDLTEPQVVDVVLKAAAERGIG